MFHIVSVCLQENTASLNPYSVVFCFKGLLVFCQNRREMKFPDEMASVLSQAWFAKLALSVKCECVAGELFKKPLLLCQLYTITSVHSVSLCCHFSFFHIIPPQEHKWATFRWCIFGSAWEVKGKKRIREISKGTLTAFKQVTWNNQHLFPAIFWQEHIAALLSLWFCFLAW